MAKQTVPVSTSSVVDERVPFLHQGLSESERACVATMMLKVLDGKCKMRESDKRFIAALYDALLQSGQIASDSRTQVLIATARDGMSESLGIQVYEARLLAETRLGRPVMQAFKARLREAGFIR